ncbi:probable WRKY transcription factor 70 isoform X2 [Gossypium hirsutum]|uniref:Probable WRKY transcription factor 70 isoform X2 n=1 Tax=Gossypium hirsutum TaxID=3635 RepID=A0ABM3BYL8_GOSHI|nr:probable WRKY transcription factor 70 isoform X2 [Gossypium hirsutum]
MILSLLLLSPTYTHIHIYIHTLTKTGSEATNKSHRGFFFFLGVIRTMDTLYPWPEPETLSSNKKRVIQKLVEGQQCATELQVIVLHNNKPPQQAEELVQKILWSFNQTLSMLAEAGHHDEVISQNQATCNDDCKSQDSSESSKRSLSAFVKDKRGCYKRKSYFRCSHKHDQGCSAIKQVQRMEDDAQMYHITYIGTHTCRDQYSSMATPRIDSPSPILKLESEEQATTPSNVTDLDSMTMWTDVMMGGVGFETDVVSNMYSCTEITCLDLEPVELENGLLFDDTDFA